MQLAGASRGIRAHRNACDSPTFQSPSCDIHSVETLICKKHRSTFSIESFFALFFAPQCNQPHFVHDHPVTIPLIPLAPVTLVGPCLQQSETKIVTLSTQTAIWQIFVRHPSPLFTSFSTELFYDFQAVADHRFCRNPSLAATHQQGNLLRPAAFCNCSICPANCFNKQHAFCD